MEKLLASLDPILLFTFRLHDGASDWLVHHLQVVKTGLLLIAHLALFGFFFPDLRKEFGQAAGNLLIVILFLSPLSKIFRARLLLLLMGLRRYLGIMFAYLATVHGLGYLIDPAWNQVILGMLVPGTLFGIDTPFLMGMIAYALTLPLFFTSNDWAQRKLGGRRWKLLHRSVYALFVFAVFHRLLIRGADPISQVQALILLVSYILAKLIAWKNFLPPLVRIIDLVSARYHVFRQRAIISPPSLHTPPPPSPPAS